MLDLPDCEKTDSCCILFIRVKGNQTTDIYVVLAFVCHWVNSVFLPLCLNSARHVTFLFFIITQSNSLERVALSKNDIIAYYKYRMFIFLLFVRVKKEASLLSAPESFDTIGQAIGN